MIDTTGLTKLYYSIGEVSEMFDVAPSLIRYWESEFSTLKPKKSRNGDRRFTKENIVQLNEIYHLVKDKGYTLEGAKRELKDQKKMRKQKQDVLYGMQQLVRRMKKLRAELD